MSIRCSMIRAFAVLAAFALTACGGGGEGGTAKIRLLNLSTGYSSLDLITNIEADDNDDDKTQYKPWT